MKFVNFNIRQALASASIYASLYYLLQALKVVFSLVLAVSAVHYIVPFFSNHFFFQNDFANNMEFAHYCAFGGSLRKGIFSLFFWRICADQIWVCSTFISSDASSNWPKLYPDILLQILGLATKSHLWPCKTSLLELFCKIR